MLQRCFGINKFVKKEKRNEFMISLHSVANTPDQDIFLHRHEPMLPIPFNPPNHHSQGDHSQELDIPNGLQICLLSKSHKRYFT